MKSNKSVLKACKRHCRTCRPEGHDWGVFWTRDRNLKMLKCLHCPAVLSPVEKCADCNHELEHHDFQLVGKWDCLIVVPDPHKDGRCKCKNFVIRGLAGVVSR